MFPFAHLREEQRFPSPEGGISLLEKRHHVVLWEVLNGALADVHPCFHVVGREALLLLAGENTQNRRQR